MLHVAFSLCHPGQTYFVTSTSLENTMYPKILHADLIGFHVVLICVKLRTHSLYFTRLGEFPAIALVKATSYPAFD